MALQIVKIDSLSVKNKCSIYKDGRLGFTQSAAKLLKLKRGKWIQFTSEKGQKKKDTLFIIVKGKEDSHSFRVNQSGKYFYLSTSKMFDDLGYDYRTKKYVFDIKKSIHTYESNRAFKLELREKKKRS